MVGVARRRTHRRPRPRRAAIRRKVRLARQTRRVGRLSARCDLYRDIDFEQLYRDLFSKIKILAIGQEEENVQKFDDEFQLLADSNAEFRYLATYVMVLSCYLIPFVIYILNIVTA